MLSNTNINLSYNCVRVAKCRSEIAIRIALQVLGSALLTKHCLVIARECFSPSVLLGNDVSMKILFTFNVLSSTDILMTN